MQFPGSDPRTLLTGISHIALMTPDIDRLAAFYETVFDARVVARSDGQPRKRFIALGPGTMLHVFERTDTGARQPTDDPFDSGSINHFALEAREPAGFLEIRARLMNGGHTTDVVFAAPGAFSIQATDPDGLFIEVTLDRSTDWTPPFETSPFVPLGATGEQGPIEPAAGAVRENPISRRFRWGDYIRGARQRDAVCGMAGP